MIFLIVNGDLYYGMYIAAMYEVFIEWQNSILNKIINYNAQNGLLNSYISLISRKVYIQDAQENEIISIGQKEDKIIENILLKIIYRNCFEKIDNKIKIDYLNYDNNKYDFDEMEIELGKLLLLDKKYFITKEDDKEYLKFIIYRYEGFRNNNSSVIIEFISKYKQIDLTAEVKDILQNYLDDKKIINLEKYEIKKIKELENMYFSLQTLLFYIFKEDYDLKESINNIIIQLPEYVVICKELNDMFQNFNNLCVDSILKIFEFFEYLCFSQIKNNLNVEYKTIIDKKIQEKIYDYYTKNKNGFILLSNNFIDAIRKLISRYLSGKRSENEINETIKLKEFIVKEELWNRDPTSDKDLNDALEDFFKKFDITVGQSLSLFNCLNKNNKEMFK